ncbi:MAG: phenylacetic acid degradation bifunctional protein PaaZ [Acidimicrobiales bacterium]|nr:phenylacetic acid degradation bifunctional protein PaaZ [Acidimicrobiales bacterium]
MRVVESYTAGRWIGAADGRLVRDAVTGAVVASVSSDGVDLGAAHDHARTVAGVALRELTFHDRAAILRAVGKMLLADTDYLYVLSHSTGATRADSAIDIDGGAGALLAYSGIGRRELPNQRVWVDGDVEGLSRDGSFVGQHIVTPRHGVAVQINAFNFPTWGMLEKFAPAFLAGVPTIVKAATPTAYVTEAVVRRIIDSGLLPEGALQFVAGSVDGLLDVLDEQDTLSFTGSAATARILRGHGAVLDAGVRFSAEADSLNAAVLAPAAGPDTAEFGLFVDEVVNEMTTKAGQKCTAIRRVIVPAAHVTAVEEALVERMRGITVGDPSLADTDMGALVGISQRDDVLAAVGRVGGTTVIDTCDFVGVDPERGAFMAPTLLRATDAATTLAHVVEPFGPVATLMTYDTIDEAVDLVAKGGGSLVASVYGPDLSEAAVVTLGIAPYHGRVHTIDASSAAASTGHGSPLPQLVHGGPGRAGGGEELGGLRSVLHYMQRTAVQGSPDLLTAVTGSWVDGAARRDKGHPFTLYFDELEVGDCLDTEPRVITLEDIEHFAHFTGDLFYAHMDDDAAKASPIFEGRVAHGYLVLSMAAGLFVWPDPGPVLANYGVDNLRFATPTYPGTEIRVIFTCKEKSLRAGSGYGEVRWDTKVVDQDDNVLASYDVLTMVAERGAAGGVR